MLYKNLIYFLTLLASARVAAQVKPEKVYDGGFKDENAPVLLRIGNGGAGQSGLVKELSDRFIQSKVKETGKHFKVAWYKSDTTFTINYLRDKVVDVGITYSLDAERLAIAKGIAIKPIYYAFRDHFYLVGPPSNPASVNSSNDVLTIFADMFAAADNGKTSSDGTPVRFLSRHDKSATNLKDALLWLGVGQVPWGIAYSTWYHQYIAFPVQALRAAILLKEYTITDRGTFLTLKEEDSEIVKNVEIYKRGEDKDPKDLLLNPAHVIIGKDAKNMDMAKEFCQWIISREGQNVIKDFKKGGEQLYTGAPTKPRAEKVRPKQRYLRYALTEEEEFADQL